MRNMELKVFPIINQSVNWTNDFKSNEILHLFNVTIIFVLVQNINWVSLVLFQFWGLRMYSKLNVSLFNQTGIHNGPRYNCGPWKPSMWSVEAFNVACLIKKHNELGHWIFHKSFRPTIRFELCTPDFKKTTGAPCFYKTPWQQHAE